MYIYIYVDIGNPNIYLFQSHMFVKSYGLRGYNCYVVELEKLQRE